MGGASVDIGAVDVDADSVGVDAVVVVTVDVDTLCEALCEVAELIVAVEVSKLDVWIGEVAVDPIAIEEFPVIPMIITEGG